MMLANPIRFRIMAGPLLILLLVMAGSAQGQSAAEETGDVSAGLQQMERTWAAAEPKHDASAVAPILADTFVETDETGKVTDRKTYLENMRNSEVKLDSVDLDDMKVQRYGDAAVVTGRYTEKTTVNGGPATMTGRFTDTFAKIHGKWKCVASQSTTIR